MSVSVLSHDEPTFDAKVQALLDRLHSGRLVAADTAGGSSLDVPKIVHDILERVRTGGDEAAARLASELDRANVTPKTLRVSEAQIAEAHASADPEFLSLMRSVIANITAYQQHILIQAPPLLERNGRKLGVRYTPIERVAVYVPGGQALYPSTVLMTVVPARVAGVREIVMVSPPSGGEINPMALALAKELGIDEVIRLGGAVGLAAVAFGTESIRKVDKIVGPGNAFVAEAKRQLFGKVGIDSIAGPSEVFIVADDSANPRWLAADMLAQAEHNPGSAVLATPSAELAQRVQDALGVQLKDLSRAAVTRPSIENNSAVLVTADLDAACALANRFATEHLQLLTRENERCLERIKHAGAIFLGQHSPVPLGDYFAGPSHVLPTGGTARFFSPLSCNDFLKASSLIEYDAASFAEDAPKIAAFAEREGLTAHAESALIRGR
ncbi:MAG TPA: histidinol dehydrogenase [Polyangiaceae bacterium]|nr:histidinol dehydrogenase [Polyangiaceae bacterium]